MSSILEEMQSLVISQVELTSTCLGEGSFGEVVEALWAGTPCAAKRLHRVPRKLLLKQQPGTVVDKFLKECKTWSRLRHPNIVLFLGVVFEQEESPLPVLIIEKMDTSLSNFVLEQPKEAFPLQYKVSVLLQVTLALCYLHSQSFIHRDLTPNNILLDLESFKTKITDFGVTGIINSGASYQTAAPGCPAFMPPEASGPEPKYNQKLDTFSFGNVVLFSSSAQWPEPVHPVQSRNGGNAILTEFERRAAHVGKMSAKEKELFLPLIKHCLENEVEKRPSSRELSAEMKKASSLVPQHQPSSTQASPTAPLNQREAVDSPVTQPNNKLAEKIPLLEARIQEISSKYLDARTEVTNLKSKTEEKESDNTKLKTALEAYKRENKALRKSLEKVSPRSSPTKMMSIPTTKWSSSTPLPVKMFMASAVSVDKAVYIGGGYNASSQEDLTDIYKLDMDSGAWVIMPRRDPEHTTSGFAMAAHKGSLHVIGGEYSAGIVKKGSSVADKVLTLDLSSPAGRWSSKSVHSLTTPRYIPGATVHMDHLIVAGGRGEDDEPVPTLEILSLESNRRSWTVTIPLRCEARPQLLMHRDKILVGGNQRDNPEYMVIKTLPSGELFDYIKLSDRQKKKKELSWESNSPQRKGAALFTRNDELMAVGGLKQQAYCYLFNEASMVWENKLPKPDTIQARERAAAVPVGEDMVLVLGGRAEHQNGQTEPVNLVDTATFHTRDDK